MNLISNAVKFSYAYKSVTVKVNTTVVELDTRRIEIIVTDQGIGMNEEDVSNLFQPYFKTTDGKSKEMNASSHGLGLSICKKISKALGGDLKVESTLG